MSGAFEGEDAGAGGEKQPQQWTGLDQEEAGGDWKSKGRYCTSLSST